MTIFMAKGLAQAQNARLALVVSTESFVWRAEALGWRELAAMREVSCCPKRPRMALCEALDTGS